MRYFHVTNTEYMKPERFYRVQEVTKKDFLRIQESIINKSHKESGFVMCSETLQESKFLKKHFTQKQWDESQEV